MRSCLFFAALLAAVAITECGHTFLGTNAEREEVHHRKVRHNSYLFQKRVVKLKFTMPFQYGYETTIQGILAYDKTHTKVSANVTHGGLGFNYVTLRMTSERGRPINYDVYIYA